MNYYLKCWSNYATFSGRARRKEYWMFVMFNILATMVVSFVDGFLGLDGVILGIYGLAAMIPGIAVTIRRLHDGGHSGWCWLIAFIPLVGWLVVLFFLCQDSVPGGNEYGPSPKANG